MSTLSSGHWSELNSLDQWLSYLEQLHSQEIDLGLERISAVAAKLAINVDFAKVITVAGTNGKGTTCAFVEHALLSRGHSVAVYSSPHIEAFNERLRLNRVNVSDQPLIDAFIKIEQARANISLTYYEYTTLAALLVLMVERPKFIILEVGLGGRLDATNMIDADVAVLTAIDLDHQAFLGNTRELIGFEKAGIMRAGKPAIVGDTDVPNSVIEHANNISAQLVVRNRAFTVTTYDDSDSWQWQLGSLSLADLPPTNIPRDNVATGLAVLANLGLSLSVSEARQWIIETKVAGRTELFPGPPDVVLDVGHNPQAARYLASYLAAKLANSSYKKVYAVVAMLADKDVEQTLAPLTDVIESWFVSQLDLPRAADKSRLLNVLTEAGQQVNSFDNVNIAYKMAIQTAARDELVLVFGSFFTVAEIRRSLVAHIE